MMDGEFFYSTDGIILILTLCKGYLLIRVYYNLSIFSNGKKNRLHFQKHKYYPNYLFSLRGDVRLIPFIIIAVGLILIDFNTGLLLLYSERSYVPYDMNKKQSLKQHKIAE